MVSLDLTASDGNTVILTKKQLRDKSHYINVFPLVKIPDTFDLEYVKKLDYKDRLKYVRDRSKLSEKTIFEMQWEACKFFRSTKTEGFDGTLGLNKIKGRIYINNETSTVAFVDKSNSQCRSFVKMSAEQLRRLRARNYHIFPNS
jgi:hypothetical protein